MRRCPECYEIYDEGEKFCEVDGQRLLADPALTSAPDTNSSDTSNRRNVQQPWLIGFVGIAVGILLCGAIYMVHAMWSVDSNPEDNRNSFSARTQEPAQSVRPTTARAPQSTESPAADEESAGSEAEASPQTSPEPAVPAQNQTVTARLNQGPVSTSPRQKDSEKTDRTVQTVILMHDGTSVEVDAAWEDKQGVWYRRGGLVSFVESQRVKAITARAEPKLSQEREVAP